MFSSAIISDLLTLWENILYPRWQILKTGDARDQQKSEDSCYTPQLKLSFLLDENVSRDAAQNSHNSLIPNLGLARDHVVHLETAANECEARKPQTSISVRVSGKQHSLFPLGPVIKYLLDALQGQL